MVDDHDAVGEVVGLVEVLRGQHDVGAVGDELADGLPEPDAAGRVEARRRLVEQQHAGRADERGAEVEPAAHAAGPAAHEAVAGVGEVEPLEHVGRSLPGIAA